MHDDRPVARRAAAGLALVAKIVVGAILAPPDWECHKRRTVAQATQVDPIDQDRATATDGVRNPISSAKLNFEKGGGAELFKTAADYVAKKKTTSRVSATNEAVLCRHPQIRQRECRLQV